MNRRIVSVLFLSLFLSVPLQAVQTNGGYVTTVPTVANWTGGWPTSGKTGWDYVGRMSGGASGVYLGNGWVLTAAHVGAAAFTVDGGTYQPVAGSSRSISDSDGTADLTLFQITTAPSLNSLSLTVYEPTPFSQAQAGSQAVLIGYGGNAGETWGYDTVDFVDELIQPTGLSYVSNDFLTVYGTYTDGSASSTNNSILVGGDSGGGDFIYDNATQAWELVGINEVVGTGTINGQNLTVSGFVQLNTYASQISAITGVMVVPEPSTWVLVMLGLASLGFYSRCRSSGQRPA